MVWFSNAILYQPAARRRRAICVGPASRSARFHHVSPISTCFAGRSPQPGRGAAAALSLVFPPLAKSGRPRFQSSLVKQKYCPAIRFATGSSGAVFSFCR